MQDKEINKVLELLKKDYPSPEIALNFQNPLQLLVATILSAQCTDVRVNQVTKDLFKKYKTASDYASADMEEFQEDIRSTGFYKNKAKNIISACQKIIAEFDGEIPNTMDGLTSLAGVARKTANVVLSIAFNQVEGVVVDTHVTRLSQKLGWTKQKNADKIEKDLMNLIPKEEWVNLSLRLILHGRQVCKAKKPNCPECSLNSICPSAEL